MSLTGLEPAVNFSQLDSRTITPRGGSRRAFASFYVNDKSVLGRIKTRIFYHLPVQLARKQRHSCNGQRKVGLEIVIIFNKYVSDHQILIILILTEKR